MDIFDIHIIYIYIQKAPTAILTHEPEMTIEL